MRGVKLGASGSKQRVSSACSKVLPSLQKSQTVSVWSPFVTTTSLPTRRTGE